MSPTRYRPRGYFREYRPRIGGPIPGTIHCPPCECPEICKLNRPVLALTSAKSGSWASRIAGPMGGSFFSTLSNRCLRAATLSTPATCNVACPLFTVITSLLTSITLLSDNTSRTAVRSDQVIVVAEHRNTAVFRPQFVQRDDHLLRQSVNLVREEIAYNCD